VFHLAAYAETGDAQLKSDTAYASRAHRGRRNAGASCWGCHIKERPANLAAPLLCWSFEPQQPR